MTAVFEGRHSDGHRAIAIQLGMKLREIRRGRSLSQEQVAYDAGIAVYTYSSLERGQSATGGSANPTLATLIRILAALDVELPEISSSVSKL